MHRMPLHPFPSLLRCPTPDLPTWEEVKLESGELHSSSIHVCLLGRSGFPHSLWLTSTSRSVRGLACQFTPGSRRGNSLGRRMFSGGRFRPATSQDHAGWASWQLTLLWAPRSTLAGTGMSRSISTGLMVGRLYGAGGPRVG